MLLQYITNTESPSSVTDQIRAVLNGGCRWIQIRMKKATDLEVRNVVETVMPWCLETESFLILDDRVELAKELQVGGVHLGKTDMLPSQARIVLGAGAVIGVTANTIDDIKAVRGLDVDYVGIGPFADTKTKKNLAPILGLEGIRRIVTEMKQEQIELPTVAVGGIRLSDVVPLMETGVNGIAVSGAIAYAPDMQKATEDFVKALEPFIR